MTQENFQRSRARRRILTLVAFALPLAVLLVTIILRGRQSNLRDEQPHIKLQKQSLLAWEKLQFTALTNRNELLRHLRSVPIRGQNLLNEDQLEKLYSATLTLADAYSLGSFDSYMVFRLPPGANYEANESQMKIIRAHWQKDRASPLPAKELDLFRWWIEKQSGGDFYRGFWQEICIDPQEIYTKLGTTNYAGLPAKAGIYVMEELQWDGFGVGSVNSTFHAGLNEYPPSFKFNVTTYAQAHRASDAKKVAAELYFFIKPSPPDPVLPVGIRYIWDQRAGSWLPIDFVVGNLHMHSGRSFVF